ncbi:MAG: IS630 family transposase [Acidobacteria bacterium]|nr:IS630 family transposase [Acidobacteriota bacterium]
MKRKQCAIEVAGKTEALAELFELEAEATIELFFGDGSGFWQTPVVARAWQFPQEEIRITPERGKRLAVFGFLNRANEARMWRSEKSVNAQFVVDCIEEWMPEKLVKPRVLVLDNARIHRSRLVRSKLAEWEEKNLYVFFLPTYSPHLNLIETLWRKMKYEWLKPEDYASFEKLTEAVKKILNEIGSQYKIKFKDRVFIK